MGRLVGVLGPLLLLACGVPAQGTYEVSGTVEAVEVAAGVVKIAHEEIPGFMPAMTMSFDVAAPELLEGVTPGASVRFTLERSATVLTITALRVTAPAALRDSSSDGAPIHLRRPGPRHASAPARVRPQARRRPRAGPLLSRA